MAPLLHPRRPAEDAPRVQAVSADALLLERLRAAPAMGAVHSVFERVVNIEPEGGGLFTLAARRLDDGPDTVVVEVDGWSGSGLARGDAVRACAGAIVLGQRIVIATAGAAPWRCALPRYPRDRARLQANLAAVREPLRAASACAAPSEAAARAHGLLGAALHRLDGACAAGDRAAAAEAVRAMIGLGPGLTPSGDDVLLGVFAAWHLPGHPCAPLAACAGDLLGDVERRTNAISVAALRAAAAGRVRESIAALLRELVDGSPAPLRAALARVLAIGSSSGADIVRGLLAGLAMRER